MISKNTVDTICGIFDEDRYKHLKRLYEKAVEEKEEMFLFEGQFMVTGFAKYVLEYLDTKFKKDGK